MIPADSARLLASMNVGRLVILCGAGLSMAAPSSLPSAWRVAEMCFDEYQLTIDPLIDPALRDNLEALAEHFVGLNTLKAVFIEHLVPWEEFERPPNPGHAAVADFLIIKTVVAGLSSNYDKLIERCAWDYVNGSKVRSRSSWVRTPARAIFLVSAKSSSIRSTARC